MTFGTRFFQNHEVHSQISGTFILKPYPKFWNMQDVKSMEM
jgi:hypothetical protein